MEWQPIFEQALSYKRFLAEYGGSMHTGRWRGMYDSVRLGEAQRALLAGFTRQMNVLCLAGAWCGDCVNQCPILQRFAEAAPVIDLRFLDRDVRPEIREELSINGGQRVPVVVFCSGRMPDRHIRWVRRPGGSGPGMAQRVRARSTHPAAFIALASDARGLSEPRQSSRSCCSEACFPGFQARQVVPWCPSTAAGIAAALFCGVHPS